MPMQRERDFLIPNRNRLGKSQNSHLWKHGLLSRF